MKKTQALFIISCLFWGMSPLGVAANKGFEGWYQIEVIIFNRAPLSNAEISPKDITLKYPLNWQELKYPETLGFDDTFDLISSDALANPVDDEEEPALAQGSETQSTSPDHSDISTTQPFLTLSEDERLLNAISNRLKRRNGYRVLFHEAWRQIVTHESTAPSVLIFGGEKLGEHHELEGSININVSRYLHLQTNLWFSEFKVNAGQSRYEWPELPKNPKVLLEAIKISQDNNEFLVMDHGAELASNSYSLQPWVQTQVDSTLPDFLSSPYLPVNITTLQQKRRMRSKEIHYIDHPNLGLIIKIIPYEVPEETETDIETISTLAKPNES